MDRRENESTPEADYTTAVPLEIDDETAIRADDLLREFAEDAGLETALIVDRSGALVAGISAEAEVTVEVISALVAGASGAMRALVSRLGETGAVESLHLGGNRLVYLREIVNGFILVAVAEVARPAGLVRQKAVAIDPRLDELLREIRPVVVAPTPPPPVRSLRAIARERAALREAGLAASIAAPVPAAKIEEDRILVEEREAVRVEEIVVAEFPEEVPVEESFETFELTEEVEPLPLPEEEVVVPEPEILPESGLVEEEVEEEITPFEALEEVFGEEVETEPELLPDDEGFCEAVPRGILEPIDFGEPEIVIEKSLPPMSPNPPAIPPPVDSPFEAEDDDDEPFISLSPETVADVFEIEAEDDFLEADEEEDLENSHAADSVELDDEGEGGNDESDDMDAEDLDDFDNFEEDVLSDDVDDLPNPDELEELSAFLPDAPLSAQTFFEIAGEDDDEEEAEDSSPGLSGEKPFPDYVPRRPTSLFELAGDDDLEDDFDDIEEEGYGDDVEDEEDFTPVNVFEVDTSESEDDDDLVDEQVELPVRHSITPVPPEPVVHMPEDPGETLEEMIAEEEEESEIRSSGPFYF
jgi:predicted regulator of Ras-like GTPase activity (Roadblock/LC7/MglB family)